jgi:predicted Zn-dependent peptidase
MFNSNETIANKMHPDSMKIASIHNDLDTLDYDIKQLEAESWRRINAGTSFGEVNDQFEASKNKLIEAFVSDLKHYLTHGTYPDKI